MDWELVENAPVGSELVRSPLLAAAFVLGAQSMRSLVSGYLAGSSAWLLGGAVIASAALLGMGAAL